SQNRRYSTKLAISSISPSPAKLVGVSTKTAKNHAQILRHAPHWPPTIRPPTVEIKQDQTRIKTVGRALARRIAVINDVLALQIAMIKPRTMQTRQPFHKPDKTHVARPTLG